MDTKCLEEIAWTGEGTYDVEFAGSIYKKETDGANYK
jgi:hypothetical protein